MTNHVVIFSGGMDSFTLLHSVIAKADEREDLVFALSFNYKQRHARELSYAVEVCADLHIPHKLIDLAFLSDLAPHSALTDHASAMPHGHYAAESMKQTVVPGRNTLMLAAAMAFAEGLSADQGAVVYYGAHAGDHHIYPDCRPDYIEAVASMFSWATGGRVRLAAPFQWLTKGQILEHGIHELNLSAKDYGDTWTCYEGGEHPCGLCGSCVERAEAFAGVGLDDPLITRKQEAAAAISGYSR